MRSRSGGELGPIGCPGIVLQKVSSFGQPLGLLVAKPHIDISDRSTYQHIQCFRGCRKKIICRKRVSAPHIFRYYIPNNGGPLCALTSLPKGRGSPRPPRPPPALPLPPPPLSHNVPNTTRSLVQTQRTGVRITGPLSAELPRADEYPLRPGGRDSSRLPPEGTGHSSQFPREGTGSPKPDAFAWR